MKTKTNKTPRELSLLILLLAATSLAGCGVRGRPQPPLQPAELGRGQPNFKRATEEFAFPEVPSPTPAPDPKLQQDGK